MKEKLLRDTQTRDVHELGEMKRAQELRVDEFSLQKMRESHETIQRLTAQMQEMQELMNSMNDSGEFQEVGSNHSGRLSYVPSQPEVIPSSFSMLSRDKRLPFDTWNAPGSQENVFGNQFSTFCSSQNHHQGIDHGVAHKTRKETESVPRAIGTGTSFARDDEQNKGTIRMPMFARRFVDHEFVNTSGCFAGFYGWTAKTANIGTAMRQVPAPSTFLCWKIRFKNQATSCSDFPSEAMLWIIEVEMVDSLDEFKILAIGCWK